MTEEQIQKYTSSLKLCEHGNYHCAICEIRMLKLTIDEYQQQQKRLIEALELTDAYLEKGSYLTAGDVIKDTLQQIQGNK